MIVSVHVYAHTACSESQTCVHLAPPPNEMYFNVEPHCRTSIPGSRYGHTVCSYRDKVYMYGGRNDEDGSFSKVDCYDISKSKQHEVRTCTHLLYHTMLHLMQRVKAHSA